MAWCSGRPIAQPRRNETDGKRLRNLRAPLRDHVAAHAADELPAARSPRNHGPGPGLFCLADPGRGARNPGRHRVQRRGGQLAKPQFHLQDREMAYATGRCMCNGMLRHPFSVEHVTLMVRHVYGDRVTFHSGSCEVAPGVTLHRVGGHSDGLQVVRVETARGPVVLASDASHYYANMHRKSPFPILYNLGDMFEGWNIVARLAGHPDRVIPGHDPIVTEIYPRASDEVDAYAL